MFLRMRNWSLDLFVSFAIKRKRKENDLEKYYFIVKYPLKISALKKMSWVIHFRVSLIVKSSKHR
jgi:hypothetical protein